MMSIAGESELLMAALRYIAVHCEQDNHDELLGMGLSEKEIELIPSLALDEILLLTRSHAIGKHLLELHFKPGGLTQVVEHVRREKKQAQLKVLLMKHGAPQPLMFEFFRTGFNEYSQLRKKYELSGGNGRPSYRESEEIRLWRVYQTFGKPRAELTAQDYFNLYQQSLVSLRVIWRLFENWDAEGISLRPRMNGS
jgi:Protein of unknown function (DUF2857)